MKFGIIGLPGAGKSTIFQALTRSSSKQRVHKGSLLGTVQVSDERVDTLSKLYKPKKTVYGHLEYLLPAAEKAYGHHQTGEEGLWNEVRPCNALIHVVRNFRLPGGEPPHPRDDLLKLESEIIFADLVVAEKRIERMNLDKKRGKKISEQEMRLLERCVSVLEKEAPLRDYPDLAASPILRGYTFLSAKPMLVVFNNDDEDENPPSWEGPPVFPSVVVVRGKLEIELSELSPDEAEEFFSAYHIDTSAMERLVRHSCRLLHLISFFTVVHNEVRSWLIPEGTTALDAAGVIHSDMKKGFIRAEVLPYDDLIATGSYQQARKEAKVRLEGKDYVIQDGEVICFRFNV